MRTGIRACVAETQDLSVSDEVSRVAAARDIIAKVRPELLLVDMSPPTQLCLTTLSDLHALFPNLPVLVLSTQDEAIYAERTLRAGASGYVMEQAGCETLMKAIRSILGGQLYVSPVLSQAALEKLAGREAHASAASMDALSAREFDVFQLIGHGKSTREISDMLHLSPKTVAVHRNHIRAKLKVHSSAELVQAAIRFCQTAGGEVLSKGYMELSTENKVLQKRVQALSSELAALRKAGSRPKASTAAMSPG